MNIYYMHNGDNELQAVDSETVQNLVYTIRGQQVMLDSDLAQLYGYEVKRLNEQVKRNINRFPEDFMFQLTLEEIPERLKSQISILNESGNKRGSNIKKLPYAFTEQGIYMLATVLRGGLAEQQSIYIMRAFREMRHFLWSHKQMFDRIDALEYHQKQTDEKIGRIFEYLAEREESSQKIFFDGQIFDAFSLLTNLVSRAEQEIILIDGYVDVNTLNILAKKNTGVSVTVYTYPSATISKKDISVFNAQYPKLHVERTTIFHDRFLILDGKIGYHIGASMTDAGRKCFGINKIEAPGLIDELLRRAPAR